MSGGRDAKTSRVAACRSRTTDSSARACADGCHRDDGAAGPGLAAGSRSRALLCIGHPDADCRAVYRKTTRCFGLSDDPQFIPYALRHTCASRLAQAGVSMMVIKEWLGHRNIATTSRYTHLAPKDLRNAAQVLSS